MPKVRWQKHARGHCSCPGLGTATTYRLCGHHSAASPSFSFPSSLPILSPNSEGSAPRIYLVKFAASPFHFIFPTHVLLWCYTQLVVAAAPSFYFCHFFPQDKHRKRQWVVKVTGVCPHSAPGMSHFFPSGVHSQL